MKTKQEQIDEMARCMGEKNFLCADDCENCIQIPCKCKLVKQSKLLYKAGYRKASDVIDEFVKKITCRLSYDRDSELYDKTIFVLMLNKIVAEMRQEMEK